MSETIATTSLLTGAAAAMAGTQHYPAGTLYVVATPIGNLADLTLRAIHVLALVDAVACEDTRVTAQLLQRLGLHKPLLSLHEHNEAGAARTVIARLQAGERVAYASDAGTPAVSDPGAVLVAAVQAAGLRVMPLPGASSVVTALSAAGDAQAEGFRFAGFLPPREAARRAALQALVAERGSVVLFEAPHRIEALAVDLAALAGAPGRHLTVCRELTKQFEQIHTLAVADFPAWLAASPDHGRGEFVLVLHAVPAGGMPSEAPGPGSERLLQRLLEALPLKQAVALTAELTGKARNELYAQALAWRDSAQGVSPDVAAEPSTPAEPAARLQAPAEWPDPRQPRPVRPPRRRTR